MPLTVCYLDGWQWRLAADVSYRSEAGAVSTVRKDFVFDWASVPRWLRGWLPAAGLKGQPYGMAALWHDWLYVHQEIAGVAITREQADALFLEIMLYCGVCRPRAWVLWSGVRLGGWWAWRRAAGRAGRGKCVGV